MYLDPTGLCLLPCICMERSNGWGLKQLFGLGEFLGVFVLYLYQFAL